MLAASLSSPPYSSGVVGGWGGWGGDFSIELVGRWTRHACVVAEGAKKKNAAGCASRDVRQRACADNTTCVWGHWLEDGNHAHNLPNTQQGLRFWARSEATLTVLAPQVSQDGLTSRERRSGNSERGSECTVSTRSMRRHKFVPSPIIFRPTSPTAVLHRPPLPYHTHSYNQYTHH